MLRIVVNAAAPEPDAIGRAASMLRAGAAAAIPTDTLYGLAADPFNPAAVGRLFTIKRRDLEKALPLIAADTAQVVASIGPLTPTAAALAARYWPGPLTMLLDAPPTLAPEVTGGSGRVGVRVPDHAAARALCAAVGVPLTATSANISGRPATADPDVVAAEIGAHLDLLLDAGQTPGGPPSTIVDVTGEEPRLIRAGAIAWDAVLAAARPR
jgi:L-threonylcarbamoyladenylate synthase